MFNDNIPSYQRQEIINTRISNRNIPSQELEPQYSFYPKSTKYIQQPILDSRNIPPQKNYEIYTTQTFNPGSRSPWQGFVNAINIETELKQPQKNYIPNSKSDLYKYPTISSKYTSYDDQGMRKLPSDKSKYIFHNHTRN
jgi:hypothetical protein